MSKFNHRQVFKALVSLSTNAQVLKALVSLLTSAQLRKIDDTQSVKVADVMFLTIN